MTTQKHLPAELARLERALLRRAASLAEQVAESTETSADSSGLEVFEQGVTLLVRALIAKEFQRLSEELHEL